MSGHTPGPWKVLEWADEKKGFIAVVGSGDPAEHVCDVFPFGKRAECQTLAEHRANARLIAAAPDLLAALEYAAQTIDALDHRGGKLAHPPASELIDRALSDIRAAIAKATASDDRDSREPPDAKR